ncbi:MAG: nucleotide sugar epimerase [Planctomycetota bacterium]|nr:MAG: nucleotide sugar epimerase [Planctomycetota bacterium]
MSTYLVTGAAGFIGSRVARLLVDAGHRVVGIDSLNDAYDARLKHWRLAQLTGRAGFAFEQLDITDRPGLAARFAADTTAAKNGPPYDAVLNLAARAGVRPSVDNPWIYLDANATGTLNLLDLCRQHGVGKFVLSSTSSLYGAHNPVPYREDADTNRPLSPYAASKKAAEAMCYSYHHLHKIDVTVLRYFTVYGPAGRPDMSVFRFVRNIAEGDPITVFGDGSQQRDFTYIDDIARGTIAAIKPVGYDTINLGSDRPVKLIEVIRKIESLVGREAKIEYRPAHPADVPATWSDIQRAEAVLGWRPATTIDEGLSRCVQWYLENRDAMRLISTSDAPAK